MIKDTSQSDVFDPQRWGLPAEVVASLADRLWRTWSRFRHCFKTKTRDSAQFAWVYLRGLLTMPNKRNFANIVRFQCLYIRFFNPLASKH